MCAYLLIMGFIQGVLYCCFPCKPREAYSGDAGLSLTVSVTVRSLGLRQCLEG